MVRLHLIGFTTDLRNLIFANRRTAKRGGYIVEIDKRLLGALEEVAKLEAEGEAAATRGEDERSSPTPAPAETPASPPSALSPKEIQALLREGKSEQQVAKLARTDVSWIRRFTAPIIAERAGVIESVKAGLISKPRLGPSSVSVGQAVQQNLEQKRVGMDPDDFEKSWKASRRAGRWQVVFEYSSRGKRRVARFAFDPEKREVSAANDVALDVGWRPNNLKKPRRADAERRSSAAARARRGRSPSRSAAGRKKSTAKKAPGTAGGARAAKRGQGS